ncbi:diguanylate cyclase (GGDEF)-like protein [Geothermobacter ehrlichii]|uniref:diguanylate cyclase n=1 Tax=Geothermobacter ehrlichii TaxID=213224 RepID=A0A5D3WPR0_9BACT|nr:GGDEF domain-containing protein [Geothermobacter ehrlichii]TYP00344.1 diguanylate cyclase (GGDEF)-like protein [Geothermobacter ehrlichii]
MLGTLLPVILPLVLLLALLFWPAARVLAAPYLPLLPPLVLAGGFFPAWRFNRGRPALALLLLAATGLVLTFPPAGLAPEQLRPLLSLLLPAGMVLLLLLPERGFFSLSGLLRAGLFSLLWAGALFCLWRQPEKILALLQTEWVQLPAGLGPLPAQPILLGWLLLMVAALFWLWRCPGPIEAALFWTALTGTVGLYWTGPLDMGTWLGLAGLAPCLAIIEMTHGLAFHDELTGLPGRRALNEALNRLAGRYTVAMVDIDHFKGFNDRYGHDVGDQVLKMVGSRLARVDGGGKAYRYGGEEFTLLFAGKSVDAAMPFVEQVRIEVEQAGFVLRRRLQRPRRKPRKPGKRMEQKRLSVTVSIGVAERGKGESPDEVVKRADQALYRAKQGGRNRVCRQGMG